MVGRTVFRCCLIVAALFGARSVVGGPDHVHRQRGDRFQSARPTRASSSSRTVCTKTTPIHIAQPAWMTNERPRLRLEHQGRPAGLQRRDRHHVRGRQTTASPADVDGKDGDRRPATGCRGRHRPGELRRRQIDGCRICPAERRIQYVRISPHRVVAGVPGDKTQARIRSRRIHCREVHGRHGPWHHRPVDRLRSNAHVGHGQPRLRSQHGDIPASSSRSRISASCWVPTPRTVGGHDPGRFEISVVTGKDELVGRRSPIEAQQIPEPTTWMVWAGLAGGMAWGYRRSRRSAS